MHSRPQTKNSLHLCGTDNQQSNNKIQKMKGIKFMFSIIKNRAELEEILNSEDYANKKLHIHAAGHLARFEHLDKNGNKDQRTADWRYFIVSDSKHSEETIRSEFFDMVKQDEFTSRKHMRIETDALHRVIEMYSSETVSTFYYGFWGSPELEKDDIKDLINNL